jgi:hypothetical protein
MNYSKKILIFLSALTLNISSLFSTQLSIEEQFSMECHYNYWRIVIEDGNLHGSTWGKIKLGDGFFSSFSFYLYNCRDELLGFTTHEHQDVVKVYNEEIECVGMLEFSSMWSKKVNILSSTGERLATLGKDCWFCSEYRLRDLDNNPLAALVYWNSNWDVDMIKVQNIVDHIDLRLLLFAMAMISYREVK